MTDATNPQSPDAAATPPVTPPTPAPAADATYAPPAAPAYQPPAYQPPSYPSAPPAYGASTGAPVQPAPGAPPVYGSAPYYGAPAVKTNVLAVISMIASILGFVWILPLIGSVGGAIMGHISLNQIKRTGEGGRAMALAGVIVGWVGTAISLLIIGFFVFFIILGAAASSRYGSY
ncbi:DUF4190 domain-containing protein [Microbacterium sp. PM5]|uniref:DUF4190 domain-containing protein n=1 Tax=Microbacterium sp. PM5 TaxID=2014534 RepID=UPI000DD11451|nr:DUF4190 domain-containing protein [Microbacterium sp. PM5]AXA96001.1 hypothetical protein CEP17_06025 [Microbacterium sp. PM5]